MSAFSVFQYLINLWPVKKSKQCIGDMGGHFRRFRHSLHKNIKKGREDKVRCKCNLIILITNKKPNNLKPFP